MKLYPSPPNTFQHILLYFFCGFLSILIFLILIAGPNDNKLSNLEKVTVLYEVWDDCIERRAVAHINNNTNPINETNYEYLALSAVRSCDHIIIAIQEYQRVEKMDPKLAQAGIQLLFSSKHGKLNERFKNHIGE